ncbi:MAG: hypothetical protein ACOVP1_11250 [Bacteroidia bacterium]
MKLFKSVFVLFVLISTIGISSCKKPEGEGGTGRIKGSVLAEQWNATFTVKQAEFAAMDEWVYIIYGSDISYGDRIRTNYNGEFEFKYLRAGKYKIYVYSKDKTLTSASGDVAVVKELTVSDETTTDAGTITIYK